MLPRYPWLFDTLLKVVLLSVVVLWFQSLVSMFVLSELWLLWESVWLEVRNLSATEQT